MRPGWRIACEAKPKDVQRLTTNLVTSFLAFRGSESQDRRKKKQVRKKAHPNLDSAVRSELERVAYEVLQDLFQLDRVSDERWNTAIDIPMNLETLIPVDLFDMSLRVGDDLFHLDCVDIQRHLFCIKARERHYVIDHLQEHPGVTRHFL